MSASLQRARPQMIEPPRIVLAISRTASKSPGEAIGKPASMMSTPRSTSAWATSSFSCRFMLQPGDCSPSRSVVSKILIVARRDGIGHGGVPCLRWCLRGNDSLPACRLDHAAARDDGQAGGLHRMAGLMPAREAPAVPDRRFVVPCCACNSQQSPFNEKPRTPVRPSGSQVAVGQNLLAPTACL